MKKQPLISLLELGSVKDGQTINSAFQDIFQNAQTVEKLGFHRIWIAEHHNMPTISTAATAILIAQIAERTKRIRVGSGGIMLPNHSALQIAEQFGTLDILYPGRIDLGLGRAPGTDQLTAAALRRNNILAAQEFPADVRALQQYFSKENSTSKVRAIPGEGRDVPMYILGSSTDSAYLAAELGLPYAFASHFAPAQLYQALEIYRRKFQPSDKLKEPYVMVAANVFAADTTEEAIYLRSSFEQLIVGILTSQFRKLGPPVEELPSIHMHPDVQAALRNMTACTFAGDMEKMRQQLIAFAEQTKADEIITTNYIFDAKARKHSFELLAEAMEITQLSESRING